MMRYVRWYLFRYQRSNKTLYQASVVRPASGDQRLAGAWTGSSSYQAVFGAGSWSNWGVNIGTVYNDTGSATSVGGPNFGGGSIAKRADTGDRAGTYLISGYTLELRYENGKVRRLPFFLSAANNPDIWFEGALLRPAKAAK
jgi:hypothetical protein